MQPWWHIHTATTQHSLSQTHIPNLENCISITGLPHLVLYIKLPSMLQSIWNDRVKWWISTNTTNRSSGGYKLYLFLNEIPERIEIYWGSPWNVKQWFPTKSTCTPVGYFWSYQEIHQKTVQYLYFVRKQKLVFKMYWVSRTWALCVAFESENYSWYCSKQAEKAKQLAKSNGLIVEIA